MTSFLELFVPVLMLFASISEQFASISKVNRFNNGQNCFKAEPFFFDFEPKSSEIGVDLLEKFHFLLGQ